jgi:hypothetical protein
VLQETFLLATYAPEGAPNQQEAIHGDSPGTECPFEAGEKREKYI